MNKIPGASDLGWGFNIFGPYSDTSVKSQLFQMQGGSTWTDPVTNKQYGLPDNVSVTVLERSGAESQVFDTRTQVQEFFAAKAGLEASYVTEFGAFSGAFNAAYQNSVERDSSFKYALYEVDNVAWQLTLEAQSLAQLTPEVQQAINALPAMYSRENRAAFFRFFDKYGTHYVSRARVGGRLYYYVAVSKSYLSDDQKIEADLTLEYNAVLVSGKAAAKTEWSQLTKSWADNRVVHVEVIGGSPDGVLLAAPEYGDNRSDIFKAWVEGIKTNPATIDFDLRPLSALLPADKARAIDGAMKAYLSERVLFVEARAAVIPFNPEPPRASHLPVVILGGTTIKPDVPPDHNFGFQLAVLKFQDDDYEVYLNKYYSIDLYQRQDQVPYGAIFDQMLQDIQAGEYVQPGFVIVLASFNWFFQAPPTEEFYGFLRATGAGRVLQSWIDGAQNPGSISSQDCTYIFVGGTTSGVGMGVENLQLAPLEGGPLSAQVVVRLDGVNVQRISAPQSLAMRDAKLESKARVA